MCGGIFKEYEKLYKFSSKAVRKGLHGEISQSLELYNIQKLKTGSMPTKLFSNLNDTGNPLASTFANSQDPDEILHFIRVYTVC